MTSRKNKRLSRNKKVRSRKYVKRSGSRKTKGLSRKTKGLSRKTRGLSRKRNLRGGVFDPAPGMAYRAAPSAEQEFYPAPDGYVGPARYQAPLRFADAAPIDRVPQLNRRRLDPRERIREFIVLYASPNVEPVRDLPGVTQEHMNLARQYIPGDTERDMYMRALAVWALVNGYWPFGWGHLGEDELPDMSINPPLIYSSVLEEIQARYRQ